jgi:hypothetical protein
MPLASAVGKGLALKRLLFFGYSTAIAVAMVGLVSAFSWPPQDSEVARSLNVNDLCYPQPVMLQRANSLPTRRPASRIFDI